MRTIYIKCTAGESVRGLFLLYEGAFIECSGPNDKCFDDTFAFISGKLRNKLFKLVVSGNR